MTNAMPSLQMTIKLSYGWRPLAASFYCAGQATTGRPYDLSGALYAVHHDSTKRARETVALSTHIKRGVPQNAKKSAGPRS